MLSPHGLELRERSRWIRVRACQKVVGEGAQREQIRELIQSQPAERFRRHEWRRTDQLLWHAERRQRTEVDELASAVFGGTHVPRGQVSMEQSVRMKERERRCYVAQVAARLSVWKRRECSEIVALEQLHRVVRPSRVDAVVVHLDDPRVLQQNQRVVLLAEQDGGGAMRIRQETLERENLPRGLVADAIHRSHSAHRKLRLHDVASSNSADSRILGCPALGGQRRHEGQTSKSTPARSRQRARRGRTHVLGIAYTGAPAPLRSPELDDSTMAA